MPHFLGELWGHEQEIAAEIVSREQTEPSSPLYTIPGQDGSGAYGAGPYGS